MMKLKTFFCTALVALTTVYLTSCSDEPSGDQKVESGKYSISGKVEKGPFVRGSSISIQPLNESMTTIGSVFNGEIQDDAGSFELGQIELASQFVRIASDGYYFNEVTGNLSSGMLHLVALADLSDKSTVNVNILTHLKSARIQKLVESGKTFADADKQAQKELLTQFGLQAYENLLAETMSIASGNDGTGVLIAVSSLILNNRSDAEITQYLSVLSQDLADDGSFTEETHRIIAADNEYIRDNIENIAYNIISRYEDLGITITIPDLRFFLDWDDDGVAGNEFDRNPQITLSQTEINFGKDGGEATITIDANFKYGLVPFGPQNPSVAPSEPNTFFCSIEPLSVETSLNGNSLTIKGGVNKANIKRSHTINIYNVSNDIVATVKVNFEANPEYYNPDNGLVLSDYGRVIIGKLMSKFTSAHEIYSTFIYEYCTSSSHKLYADNAQLNKMFGDYFTVVSYVNAISRLLIESGDDDYVKLIQTYNAIVYTEMMEIWGDMPLVKFTDDPLQKHYRSNMSEIRDYYIALLEEAIQYASNYKFPDVSESDIYFDGGFGSGSRSSAGTDLVNKLFFLPKDILYLALGDLYIQAGRYSEAYSYYEKAANNYAMSNSINFDRNNSELIFSPDKINLAGSRSDMRVTTWPLYFLSDIRLRMAECQLKLDNASGAQSIINDIIAFHPEFNYVSGSPLEQIDQLHRDWHHPAYFAFLKRSGLGVSKYGFETYQLLCPLPQQEVDFNPNITQNTGY